MNIKKELITFFTWFRNGTCFLFTWFVLLKIITSCVADLWMTGEQTISVDKLTLMLFGTMGAVLIFCLIFTNLIIRKAGFTVRLTIFMIIITVYEILCLNYIGIFTHFDFYQIILLLTFITPMYLICLGIYSIYRKKKGELYTTALQKYQQERKALNEYYD